MFIEDHCTTNEILRLYQYKLSNEANLSCIVSFITLLKNPLCYHVVSSKLISTPISIPNVDK